jgi:hypothetical protein
LLFAPRIQQILLRGVPFEQLSWNVLARVKYDFQSLRRLVISGLDGELEISLGGFTSLFAMPSFTRLEAYLFGDIHGPEAGDDHFEQ